MSEIIEIGLTEEDKLLMDCSVDMSRVMQEVPLQRQRHVPEPITNGRLCMPFMHERLCMVQSSVNYLVKTAWHYERMPLKCTNTMESQAALDQMCVQNTENMTNEMLPDVNIEHLG